MSMELYYAPGTASLVVHWMLIELGVPHTLKAVSLQAGEHKSPEYLRLNPAGLVPTLVIDGKPHTEAAALVMHLGDLHPQSGLAPVTASTRRASYYQWFCFCTNTLQPAYRTWFYPAEAAGSAHEDAAKSQAQAKIESAWAQVDQHLATQGPYLLGQEVSAADFMLTMLMRWSRHMPKPADTWPHVAALAKLMKARPSFAELYVREGLTEWA